MGSKKNRKKVLYCAVFLLIVLLISAAFLCLNLCERHNGGFSSVSEEDSLVEYEGKRYALRSDVEAFLVLGLDKFEGTADADAYSNDKQSDFLMLFVFDNAEKKCTAIHINRDTMANVNILGVAGNRVDTVKKQIALAHTYGNGRDVSCRNAADSVSSLLLGTKINHYISFTMDAVPVLNDLVGGVQVTVTDDFSGIDDTLAMGETVTLKGEHALSYVRTRYGLDDSTNSTRMKRQQAYLNSLYESFSRCVEADDEFIVNASLAMSDYTVSDRSVTQLQELARKFNEYEFTGIRDFQGETKRGEEFMEFYPDSGEIEETVIELFYKAAD